MASSATVGLTFYEPSPVEELELQRRRTHHLYHLFIFHQNAWVKGKPKEIVFSLDVTPQLVTANCCWMDFDFHYDCILY